METSILPGYEIAETLHESANSLIYRARTAEGDRVVLKMLKEPYPSPEKVAWFRREFEVARDLADLDGVILTTDFLEEGSRWFIAFEDFGASSLARIAAEKAFNVDEFLHLAKKTTKILGAVHARRVIHKDINPSNFVMNLETGRLKLIDFGISTVISQESTGLRDPNKLEGTLAYISPEQTGRTNRSIDYRTDFYSLGITFYELLLGRLPFTMRDPLELVHAQIARQPMPPHEVNPQIDLPLSAIILKLLEKNAEDRYQSARGLLDDLQKFEEWKGQDKPEHIFQIGTSDVSNQLQIPQKLYGREAQRQELLDAFDRVAQGAGEIVLVSGFSGIGKSALVKEIYRPVTERRGYFVSGKFDQLQRDIPYAPLIQAFRSLLLQILSENERRISEWKEKFLSALGVNAQVIIEVIPEVELVTGPQPADVELGPVEALNRFRLVFQRFIAVFTSSSHPLVLFLDDLQWTDSASLDLLQSLMTGTKQHHLLIIGAYRDNEVQATHPLKFSIRQMREADVSIQEIVLAPLRLTHIEQLVYDTFGGDRDQTAKLARAVHEKTGGNPFFLNEFLRYLHRDGIICLSFQSNEWHWRQEDVENCGVTENVVDLMIRKTQKLNASTQKVLQLAACTGNRFDLRTLAVISEMNRAETAASLWGAIVEGLVLPLDDQYKLMSLDADDLLENLDVDYRFAHDRIQQAAYSMIEEDAKRRVHWQVGKLMLKNTASSEVEEHIFDIVQQLNQGLEHASDPEERLEIARLNLLAGEKSKISGAYATAFSFFSTGFSLLSQEEQADKRLMTHLAEEAAETACLIGDYDAMRSYLSFLFHHAQSLEERLKACQIEIQAFAAEQRLPEGLDAGAKLLQDLGVEVARTPSPALLQKIEDEVVELWRDRKIEDLYEIEDMIDPRKLAAMEIMERLYVPAYSGSPDFFQLIVFHEVILSIRFGMTSFSSRGIVAYGTILCSQGKIEAGYAFGQLALRLVERFQGRNRASVVYMVNNFIRHFRENIANTIDAFPRGYQSGLDSGDLEFAAMNLWGIASQSFWAGKNLNEFVEQSADSSATLRRLKQDIPRDAIDIFRQTALNLLGESESPVILTGEAFNESTKVAFFKSIRNVSLTGRLYVCKLMLAYLFSHDEQAAEFAHEADIHSHVMPEQMTQQVIPFYDSLIILRKFDLVEPAEQKDILDRVDLNQRKLESWTDQNFLHKYQLVAAERARVVEDVREARDRYDQAISAAQNNRFVQDEALAHELASMFYRRRGLSHLARSYLRDARYAYQRWGAKAKVKDLEARFPQDLARTGSHPMEPKGTRPITSTSEGTVLDLGSILKASQALSGEIVLEKLLGKLLRTVIENAGAEHASLILEKEGELRVEAEGSLATEVDDQMRLLESIPLAKSERVLPAIVHRVRRTLETAVLNNASEEGDFTADPYVRRMKPKSILCMPLANNQGKLTAILYLENNLATGAFTHERTEVLNLLSAEMTISIDNARLYQELESANRELEAYSHTLEDKVEQRTQELAARNQQLRTTLESLEAAQQQLVMREKMASLGRLTAGIAHEIRNPLNFVNNLSRISIELVEELGEQLQEDLLESKPMPGEVQDILDDLHENSAVIQRHGERANSIVSSMLLHTQTSSDQRISAEINELVRRAIQFAYHGLKARDSSFETEIEEIYEESDPKVDLIPQDISRMLINLIENACYAARAKDRSTNVEQRPHVVVRTEDHGDSVLISVRDNGIGIPQEHLDQIFNPFYTTKPPGEGTGLGLSMSYDIVVNKHQGKLEVDTREAEFTEFKVLLPKSAKA